MHSLKSNSPLCHILVKTKSKQRKERVFQPAILAKCLCTRTGFSQPARKKLVLFHGQEDVGVQYTSVPSSLLQGRDKKLLYIAWASWSLHTV
jgi:hypothetical protein